MRSNHLRQVPLAAACLLALYQPISHAQDTNGQGGSTTPYEIPISIQVFPLPTLDQHPTNPLWTPVQPLNPYPDQSYQFANLYITISLNGGAPESLLLDTGSTALNIDAGKNYKSVPWLPASLISTITPGKQLAYGDGSYGNDTLTVTANSIQFYKPGADQGTTTLVDSYSPNKKGLSVSLNTQRYSTGESLGSQGKAGELYAYYIGPGYRWYSPAGYAQLQAEAAAGDLSPQGVSLVKNAQPLFLDQGWQTTIDSGQPSGIFGAGPFDAGNLSVLGQMTTSGYVVAANSELGARTGPSTSCGSCAHVIMNLDPAIRAQFTSIVPWSGSSETFPGSGAPVQGGPGHGEFGVLFTYVLNHSGPGVTLPTLLDSGTPEMTNIFSDTALATQTAAGIVDPNAQPLASGSGNAQGNIVANTSLTMTGAVPGAQATTMTTVSPYYGNAAQMLSIQPTNMGGDAPLAIVGYQFFMVNSVMYDLQNESTGYTPFFVSVDPISTGKGYAITGDMAPQGIAGVISGAGAFTIANGGSAQLTNINTYTGATVINKGGWLGLAVPGSIATSSGLQADGTFDISRVDPTAYVTSLSGAGTVALGANTLELTNAAGTFSGQLTDGGYGGGTGGGVIIAGGTETLSGANTFTGSTGIGPKAALQLTGSLAGSVLDAGVLTGNGKMGSLAVTGTVAPGNGLGMYQTLTVNGTYHQQSGSTYIAQINPHASSQLSVLGSAKIDADSNLQVIAAVASPSQPYVRGTQYTLLSAKGGLNGTYSTVATPTLSAVLALAPSYDAQNVYLRVVQTAALNLLGGTHNEVATLAGVQSLPADNPLFVAVSSLPNNRMILAAADRLSGDIHASTQAAFLDDSRFIRDAVTSRLYQAANENSDASASVPGPTVQTHANGIAVWGKFVGSWDRLDSDGNAARLTDSVGGFLVGADMGLGEHTRVGVAGGYTQTAFQSAYSSHSSSNDGYLGLYAGGRWNRWDVNGGLAFTQHNLTVSRSEVFPGFTDATSSRNKAYNSEAFGEVGYRLDFHTTTLEPFAQAAYVQLRENGFDEHDGPAALTGHGTSHGVTYATLGAHAASQFVVQGDTFTAFGTLGWRHASGYVDPASVQHFQGGTDFVVNGAPMAKNAAVVDAGMQVKVLKDVSLSLSYNGQIASHAVDSGFNGSFTWQF
nr:autotransporter domain-containing protein [Dyella sp. ASV24]